VNVGYQFDVCSLRWVYTRSFAIDGNFTASHQRQKCPDDDVPLTNGESFMTESSTYKEHLKVARESKRQACTCNEFKADRNVDIAKCDATGIGSVVCLRNGFFIPEATVDFQRGEQ
jgi:Kyakuja-Dileera-Zisupton transposase